ncbi:PREDICTED: uncharacterized protein LOC107064328 isoform X2 [Polistes dominula]|uniref:Uncharacterized protein LOC107064328 isoform X2 n=1 Tax=Polistes dominula TaxID=743375 RepID=A0ABM1HWT9_POLDO|nr:PREDICTED: uncharacterized protein LOC107064328 isoform X2 [Polistes dominula]
MQPQTCMRGFGFDHRTQQPNVHLGIVGANDTTSQHHKLQQLQHHSRGSNTMDLPLSSNPRASRNMAEKQRRDNLNTNISTMASLVPIIVGCPRRLDKISILRLATSYLRMDYTLGRGSANFLPKQFKDIDVEQYILDNLIGKAGFFLVVTSAGKIVYVSQQVERHLGHAQKELTGQSLYHYIYSEDHEELRKNLTPDEMQPITNTITSDGDSNSNSSEISSTSSSTSQKNNSDRNNVPDRNTFRKQRRMFMLRMSQRTTTRREHTQYECLNVTGVLKLADACENPQNRNARHRGTSTSNDIIFVGVAWFLAKRPLTELSITDANKEEYVTRHLVDGRIIYCDHRISIVAGYMSEEVSGMSAFKYMHKDDVRWTIIGLRQMYDRAEPCGSSCYRLLSKTGQFIYLRTHGYLEYDKNTQSFESFVCINTLVSEEEGIEFVREMKERFSATVSGFAKAAMIQNNEDSYNLALDSKKSHPNPNVEDASKLEDVITHLISDLPSPSIPEDCLSPKPMTNTQFAKAAVFSQRLPPVAAQTSKIRVKKIDHCVSTPSNNKCSNNDVTIKQEIPSNEIKEECQSLISPKTITDSIVEQEFESDGPQPQPQPQQQQQPPQQRQVGRRKNSNNSISSLRCPGKPSNLKEIMGHLIPVNAAKHEEHLNDVKPKILLGIDPLENDTSESESDVSKRKYNSKRIYNEDNVAGGTLRTKKRKNDKKYEVVSEVEHEQQQRQQQIEHQRKIQKQLQSIQQPHLNQQTSVSYIHCRTYIDNKPFSNLDELENIEQAYTPTEPVQIISMNSPNSSIQDYNIEYQELMPLEISNEVHSEQLFDLHEFEDDPLLCSTPNLEANPDFMLKIFNNLRPVMGFEKNYDEVNSRQLTSLDDLDFSQQQIVSDGLTKTHRQLTNDIQFQESEFNALKRDLENPALEAQRKNLTQLQVMSYIDYRLNIKYKSKC